MASHELSYTIAPRWTAGVEVEDTTFWLFGGVSRIRQELPTPRLQLLVAGVGPLTSLLLGAAFWVLGCCWPRPVSAGWLWARCAGWR
jgi:hypothetical protein